jgi:hypothetical protein
MVMVVNKSARVIHIGGVMLVPGQPTELPADAAEHPAYKEHKDAGSIGDVDQGTGSTPPPTATQNQGQNNPGQSGQTTNPQTPPSSTTTVNTKQSS